jgi:hypothetical protein
MSYYEDRIKALEARIEEMAMLNRMKAVPVEAKLMDRIGELNAENARLKAEVERLTNDMEYRDDMAIRIKRINDQFTTPEVFLLRAQVERLTKVGDKMADYLFDAPYPCRIFYHKWNAAKEGKQP